MKLIIKCEQRLTDVVDNILNNNVNTTSEKYITYKYSYNNHVIEINGDDYKKLIYTIKWIDDLIDIELRKSNFQFSIVEYGVEDYRNNGITLSNKHLGLFEELKKLSFVQDIEKDTESIKFNIDFYSALAWNKQTVLNTKRGKLSIRTVYVESHDKLFTVAWIGDLKGIVNTRIHYMCETSEIFHSVHCDCLQQKDDFLDKMFKRKNDLFIYAHEEGRNLGLTNKLAAYEETRINGTSTRDAMLKVANVSEKRMFEIPGDIIFQLGIKEINLWTNNPLKIDPIVQRRIKVNREKMWFKGLSEQSNKYINEKIREMDHIDG